MNYCPPFDEALEYAKEHDEKFGKFIVENYGYSEAQSMNKLEKVAAIGLFYFENH